MPDNYGYGYGAAPSPYQSPVAQDQIPVVDSFDPIARQTIMELDHGTWVQIEKHVKTINNTNVPLFLSFFFPIIAFGMAIYYFVRRASWDDLVNKPDIRLIHRAFEMADPEELKRMKRDSKQVVKLGRLFDGRSAYKWLIIGNIAIGVFYTVIFAFSCAVPFVIR